MAVIDKGEEGDGKDGKLVLIKSLAHLMPPGTASQGPDDDAEQGREVTQRLVHLALTGRTPTLHLLSRAEELERGAMTPEIQLQTS